MELGAYEQLRCPACLGELKLEAFEEQEDGGQRFVETGIILCDSCRTLYPIASGSPVMLRFRTAFHDWFSRTHRGRLEAFARYSLPSASPRPGELDIQETFTDEWNLTRDNELSFIYTFEGLVDLNKRVWLRSVVERPPKERPNNLLDVGCGVGMETMAVREATGAKSVFGIDSNFALLSRRDEYRRLPDVNFVIASLFDLPFPQESFDLVYCQGVLHHTYSTADAFRAIAPRVRPGGNLFVWVYGLEDHLAPPDRSWKRRHFAAESALRPFVSRSPRPLRNAIFKALVAASHARERGGAGGKEIFGDEWSAENTEHALRDWLSPRYAHRHGFNEVMELFETTGFEIEDVQSPAAYKKLFDRTLWGVGMTGKRLDGGGDVKRSGAEAEHASVA